MRRGFSTGAILAHALSIRIDVPTADVLTLRPGPANASLSAADRRSNLAGRLRISRRIRGRILLVDDVVTTGSTAAAAAAVLAADDATIDLAALCFVEADIA